MKRKITEHIFSISLVTSILLILIFYLIQQEQQRIQYTIQELEPYLEQSFINIDEPFQKALLKETIILYSGRSAAYVDSLISELEQYRTESILGKKRSYGKALTSDKWFSLLGMYLKFILAYLIIIVFTYYAVQTLAIIRFTRYKQNRESYLAELYQAIKKSTLKFDVHTLNHYIKTFLLLLKAFGKGLFSLILFAPAYVIAYSFRTRFDTESFLFMILLGVISNGLLINYAQKFFTFLVTESRKGYVNTAIVKNLHTSYNPKSPGGIFYHTIFSIRKHFPNHVFEHIYKNARYQYLSTIKEQASFLITGLIIIEMALNIHGHLCYELLQNILYKNYVLVLTILLGIFYLVKATEIIVDWMIYRINIKYENRN